MHIYTAAVYTSIRVGVHLHLFPAYDGGGRTESKGRRTMVPQYH